jgi:transcriptional regulator with XRE-family HTH domain
MRVGSGGTRRGSTRRGPASAKAVADRARAMADRAAFQLGQEIHAERVRRRWRLADLSARSGLAIPTLHGLEAGNHGSLLAYARVGLALGLPPRFGLAPDRVPPPPRDADPVHAAMGEAIAAHLRDRGLETLVDEPYQHFQFAGRADLLAIDRSRRALLHVESRTRFPDIGGFVGSYNAKRAYLAADVARRLGPDDGFRSVTHVVAALWSSEVLHVLRLREATFRSVCPDPLDAFDAWWSGAPPAVTGTTSALVVLDPLPGLRRTRRRWVGLDRVPAVEPRYRGYAEALAALRAAGRA